MVEIRVTVEDDTRVPRLVRRLATIFERSSISFDPSRNEVRVESEWNLVPSWASSRSSRPG